MNGATETSNDTELATRVERLEAEIEKINRVLLFHTQNLGQAPGPRRAYDSFEREIEITNEQLAVFGRAVGGEG